MSSRITPLMVGAAGEKLVEAKLLRRGWLPANVNASVRNVAKFDIHAEKDGRVVSLRVKTCGPGLERFRFSNRFIAEDNVGSRDFTILVALGMDKSVDDGEKKDQFYVVPTTLVHHEAAERRKHYLKTPKRDGSARKDTDGWALNLFELKKIKSQPGFGLRNKWQHYSNNWEVLESDFKGD
jgi:hypothetical protein